MLPFEFTILGPPVSVQTRNRKNLDAWKAKVKNAARAQVSAGSLPVKEKVTLKITYYYDGDPLDTDNMVKPIQDAMRGIVYEDDNQVIDVHASKRSFDGKFKIKRGDSRVLLNAVSDGREFLYIVVERAPDEEELVR